MTLLKALIGLSSVLLLNACVSSRFHIAGDVVCRSMEGKELCPKLSHLETGIELSASEDWEARLSYDFAQSLKETWRDRLDTFNLDLPPQKSWLADYGIRRRIDDRLSLAIEDTNGTTRIPDASNLAFSNKLQDLPWKQTALSLKYLDPETLELEFLLGSGEGERLRHEDDGLFYGLRTRLYFSSALAFQLGMSLDKGRLHRDQFFWLDKSQDSHQAMSARRLSASLLLTGKTPFARGLQASLGWQANRFLSNQKPSPPQGLPTHLALDPTEILTETFGKQGETKRESLYLSSSYRILAEYILAFHIGLFHSHLGSELLTSCESLDSQGLCQGVTDVHHSLSVREQTFGLGKIDEDGWSFLLESHEERYDRLYQNFHFRNGQAPRQKYMRLIQARIAWNW